MSLAPVTESQVLLTLPYDVWALIFSWLKPEELSRFAQASQKCHQFIQRFNPLGRLENVRGFANEVIFAPWDQHLCERVSLFAKVMKQRLLSDEETAELLRLMPEWDHQEFTLHEGSSPLTILNPSPMALFSACPETPGCPRSRIIFSHFVNAIPRVPTPSEPSFIGKLLFGKKVEISLDEIRACYLRLSRLVFSVLSKMGPYENTAYVAPAARLKTLAQTKAQTSNFEIEEAAWFIVSLLKGKEIPDSEEDCKEVIRHALANTPIEVLRKMEQIIEATFGALKPLYQTCHTIECNQRKNYRQIHLGEQATRLDNNGTVKESLARIAGLLSFGFLLKQLVIDKRILTYILPTNYHGSSTHYFLDVIGCMAVAMIAWQPTLVLRVPIQAEIIEMKGYEVINYTPHPLRSRARLYGDIVLISATAFLALQLISNLF